MFFYKLNIALTVHNYFVTSVNNNNCYGNDALENRLLCFVFVLFFICYSLELLNAYQGGSCESG